MVKKFDEGDIVRSPIMTVEAVPNNPGGYYKTRNAGGDIKYYYAKDLELVQKAPIKEPPVGAVVDAIAVVGGYWLHVENGWLYSSPNTGIVGSQVREWDVFSIQEQRQLSDKYYKKD